MFSGVPFIVISRPHAVRVTVLRLQQVHPLQAGILRLRHPSERRSSLPREAAWIFWTRFIWQTLEKHVILAGASCDETTCDEIRRSAANR